MNYNHEIDDDPLLTLLPLPSTSYWDLSPTTALPVHRSVTDKPGESLAILLPTLWSTRGDFGSLTVEKLALLSEDGDEDEEEEEEDEDEREGSTNDSSLKRKKKEKGKEKKKGKQREISRGDLESLTENAWVELGKASNALSSALALLNILFHPLDDPTDPSTYISPSSLPLPSGALRATPLPLYPTPTQYDTITSNALSYGYKQRDIQSTASLFFAAAREVGKGLEGKEEEWKGWVKAREDGWRVGKRGMLWGVEKGRGGEEGEMAQVGVRVGTGLKRRGPRVGGARGMEEDVKVKMAEEERRLKVVLWKEGKFGSWMKRFEQNSGNGEEGRSRRGGRHMDWEKERWITAEGEIFETLLKDARSPQVAHVLKNVTPESISLSLPSGYVLELTYSIPTTTTSKSTTTMGFGTDPLAMDVDDSEHVVCVEDGSKSMSQDDTLSNYACLLTSHLFHTALSHTVTSRSITISTNTSSLFYSSNPAPSTSHPPNTLTPLLTFLSYLSYLRTVHLHLSALMRTLSVHLPQSVLSYQIVPFSTPISTTTTLPTNADIQVGGYATLTLYGRTITIQLSSGTAIIAQSPEACIYEKEKDSVYGPLGSSTRWRMRWEQVRYETSRAIVEGLIASLSSSPSSNKNKENELNLSSSEFSNKEDGWMIGKLGEAVLRNGGKRVKVEIIHSALLKEPNMTNCGDGQLQVSVRAVLWSLEKKRGWVENRWNGEGRLDEWFKTMMVTSGERTNLTNSDVQMTNA